MGDPVLERMLNAAAIFVRNMHTEQPPRWLSLVGASGTGKTHLASRVWQWYRGSRFFKSEVLETKEIVYPGQWIHWPTMVEQLRSQEGYGVMAELQTERFVVFDEIGASRDKSGFASDALANLLCIRAEKWTLCTSNLSPAELAELDIRIASRMIRGRSVMVQCDTTDFALRPKPKPQPPSAVC